VPQSLAPTKTVRAAGGVIVRDGMLAVVHRPKYDDWTFPKGKQMRGETDEETAHREITEETGFVCALGDELTTITYVDRKGRPKDVRFWLMSVVSGEFAPTDEVDQLRWVTPDAARSILSYDRDREVLDAFVAASAR
jgi:8-oxo-dGTP diphosphatase